MATGPACSGRRTTLRFEPCDLGRAEAELRQDLRRLRAERLRRQAHLGGLAVVEDGMVDQRDRRSVAPAPGTVTSDSMCLHLRVVDDRGIALHRRVPDLLRLHARDPFGGGRVLQASRDQLADLVLPRPGVLLGEGREPRLADRLGSSASGESDSARWPSLVA